MSEVSKTIEDLNLFLSILAAIDKEVPHPTEECFRLLAHRDDGAKAFNIGKRAALQLLSIISSAQADRPRQGRMMSAAEILEKDFRNDYYPNRRITDVIYRSPMNELLFPEDRRPQASDKNEPAWVGNSE